MFSVSILRNKSEPPSNTQAGVEQSKGLSWWLRAATSDCLVDMHGWAHGLKEFKPRKLPNSPSFLLLSHVPYKKCTIPKIKGMKNYVRHQRKVQERSTMASLKYVAHQRPLTGASPRSEEHVRLSLNWVLWNSIVAHLIWQHFLLSGHFSLFSSKSLLFIKLAIVSCLRSLTLENVV